MSVVIGQGESNNGEVCQGRGQSSKFNGGNKCPKLQDIASWSSVLSLKGD